MNVEIEFTYVHRSFPHLSYLRSLPCMSHRNGNLSIEFRLHFYKGKGLCTC